MKEKIYYLFVTFVVFAMALIPMSDLHAESELLKSAGCKTEFFLLKDLADAYQAKTGNKMQIGPTGNKKAVELLLDQQIDFIFTCKPIQKLTKGLKLDPDAVSSWESLAIAKDPIVVVSNTENGVTNLTSEQLAKLFQGEFTNWTELGGSNLPILPAYMSEKLESGVVLLFKEFTIGAQGKLADKAMVANGPSMLGNYTLVTPGAVTFMGFNSYKEKYGDILQINGISPTRENILNGTYGLAATYYLTLDGRENKSVKDFVDFVRSESGTRAVNMNFISVSK